MKKVLFASTALVAAGLMTATTASASEKIKLELGGFSKWWVVGQFQDDSFTARNANAQGGDFNTVDIKGDNEIFFGGSTTLDNGMKVGVKVELEAGGHTDMRSDPIDESFVWLETGFGKFMVGTHNNGAYLLHTRAPDAAGNWGEGGIMTGNWAVALPGRVAGMLGGNTTAIATDGDADKITYVAPTFMGLTLGATYAPNSSEDDRGTTNVRGQTASEIYGVGGLYANTFGDVGLKISGGWATYDIETASEALLDRLVGGNNADTHLPGNTTINEYTVGTQLSMAGFTVGGSYRHTDGFRIGNNLEDALDGKAWDVGVQYATGPYAVSLAYFQSKTTGDYTVAGDDKITFIQASGKYNLGAGVDVLGSIGHAKYDDETTTDANNNKGWTVMTGLGLSF